MYESTITIWVSKKNMTAMLAPSITSTPVWRVVSIGCALALLPWTCSLAATASGTGFAITSDGYIATNFHVVQGASAVSVRDFRDNTLVARVVRTDVANDVAILKVDARFPGLPLARSSTTRRGDSVFTLGYPNVQLQGYSVKLTEGTISSITGVRDEPNNFQISVPVQPGNSGGPLFNRDGAVIGLVVAKLSATAAMKATSTLPEAVNYAVKSNYLLELIDTDINISEKIHLVTKKEKEVPLADVVARVEPSVVLILATLPDRAPGMQTANAAPPTVPNGQPAPTLAPPTPVPLPAPAIVVNSPARQKFDSAVRAEKEKRIGDAVRLYKESAEEGDASAQTRLAYLYMSGGDGLPNDDVEAARLLKLAAAQGNYAAQTNLGLFYSTGRGGLPRNDEMAVRYYKLAADQGSAQAQSNLGAMYEKGRGGLVVDEAEAARLYRLAANQNNASAQCNLGFMYSRGKGGLAKDDTEAAKLYRLSADQNYAMAQANLGYFYQVGRGGLPKDEAEAVQLYRLAATQGNALGQNNLGAMYEFGGGGVSINMEEAIRFYRLAATQGLDLAKNNLKRLGIN